MRHMGSAGIGFRAPHELNILNPASYSGIPRRTALLGIGLEGQNYYLRTAETKTSFNSFNIRDITFGVPLMPKLGLGISVAPYSSVGYRIQTDDDTRETLADIGHVRYVYEGEGGVTQFKLGLGYELFSKVSIGVDAIYYHGNVIRYYNQYITPITGDGAYGPPLGGGMYQGVQGRKNERINSVLLTAGIQANIINKPTSELTLGATYQMGGNLRSRVVDFIPFTPSFTSSGPWADVVRYSTGSSDFHLPDIFGAGLYFHRGRRWSAGADYSYSVWDNTVETYNKAVVSRNTHTVRMGAQLTPNPGDVRSLLNSWTYRMGARYGNYYLSVFDTPINEAAITFGIGIPVGIERRNRFDVGLELGTRGTTQNGLIRENWFKFSLSVSLFAEGWFTRYRYN
jgi:hypothetical protein